jgi:hypothetical protein
MIKIYLVLLVMVLASGCAPFREIDTITQVVPGPIVEVPVPAPSLTEALVAEKNLYRELQGQTPLTQGLVCTVHNSNNPDLTAAWPSAAHTYVHKGVFNQPNATGSIGVNILPENLRPIYINNYRIRCQGQIVVVTSGYYLFKLSSDDGSMLYINNSLLISNNFNHGIQTVQGTRLLERGIHGFKLEYAQSGGGLMALILETQSGLVPANVFYR